MFRYPCGISSKRLASLVGSFLRHSVRVTQLLSKKCHGGGGEPLATLFDLTGPRFELQTSRTRDERVAA